MKQRHRCPKCEGTEILAVKPWNQPEQDNSNRVTPMVAQSFAEGHLRESLGTLELWVCRACGFSEMYVSNVDELAIYADQYGSGVTTVRGASDGEYR